MLLPLLLLLLPKELEENSCRDTGRAAADAAALPLPDR
jgi:hypothetical protein